MTCVRCRRPVDGTVICATCIETFQADLKALPALLADLQVSVTRQSRTTRGIRHTAELLEDVVAVAAEAVIPAQLRSVQGRITLAPHVIPVDLQSAELERRCASLIKHWMSTLAGDPEGEYLWRLYGSEWHELRWYLSRQRVQVEPIRWLQSVDIQQRADAGQWITQLRQLVHDIERAVDSSEPDIYLGPCDASAVDVKDITGTVVAEVSICGTDMYARIGDKTVTCTKCQQVYNLADRRAWLLEAVRDVWARHSLIATALAGLDVEVTFARLNNWIARDKATYESGRAILSDGVWRNPRTGLRLILQVSTEEDGRPMYRLGDVLDRMDEMRDMLSRSRRAMPKEDHRWSRAEP